MHPMPVHLREIVVPSLVQREENSVEGRVVCVCGDEEFSLMYPGQTHEYNGEIIPCTAEIGGNFFFVLRGDCLKCKIQHLLFDADFHGWNGFICHEEEQAALPRPDLIAWKCLNCGSEAHKLEITIVGEDVEEFEENAGEKFGPDSWPEAFGWFSLDVCCVGCEKITKDLVSYESM